MSKPTGWIDRARGHDPGLKAILRWPLTAWHDLDSSGQFDQVRSLPACGDRGYLRVRLDNHDIVFGHLPITDRKGAIPHHQGVPVGIRMRRNRFPRAPASSRR